MGRITIKSGVTLGNTFAASEAGAPPELTIVLDDQCRLSEAYGTRTEDGHIDPKCFHVQICISMQVWARAEIS